MSLKYKALITLSTLLPLSAQEASDDTSVHETKILTIENLYLKNDAENKLRYRRALSSLIVNIEHLDVCQLGPTVGLIPESETDSLVFSFGGWGYSVERSVDSKRLNENLLQTIKLNLANSDRDTNTGNTRAGGAYGVLYRSQHGELFRMIFFDQSQNYLISYPDGVSETLAADPKTIALIQGLFAK